jgi:hypothetical protein
MDPKELRGLLEAYSEVYAPQEEIEEGLRSAVRNLLGGGKKEETPKPESRGTQLRKKYNVGPEKSDTSAKRQILDRSRARAERDEKEFGGSKYSKSVAQKSKDAHNRYLKAGYSKYGADDARGSGNKARKRAAALSQEDFNWIVDTLLDEGYNLSSYTVEEFYDICIDEAVKGESSERRKDLAAERKAGHRPLSKKEGENYASHKLAQMAYAKRKRMGEEVEIFDVVLEFLQAEGYAETLEEAEWLMANVIDDEAISIVLGEEQLDEISLKTKMKAYSASRDVDADYNYGDKVHAQGDRIKKAIVKKHGAKAGEHAERAAEVSNFGRGTPRAKPRIEKNRTYRTTQAGKMHGQDQAKLKKDLQYKRSSRNEEYVDEAQEARNNPEKYEREQSKKSAPVRGERTPMPPRGDKRREDFEKWYAANVR